MRFKRNFHQFQMEFNIPHLRRIRRNHELWKMEQAKRPPKEEPMPRIRDNLLTLVLGLFSVFCAVVIILSNESKIIETTKAMEESAAAVTVIDPNEEIHKSMVGRLVYMTGEIFVHEPVTDPEYGISVPAVKLKRRIQMFQWIEKELNEPIHGEPPAHTFLYFTDWRDRLVNSATFENPVNHENPKDFSVKTQILVNEKVTLGRFELGKELKEKFQNFEEITSDERPENKDVKLHSGLYYHARDIWNPDIGDLRIQFSYTGMHGQEISVIGKIDENNQIVPYRKNKGSNLLLMQVGRLSKEDMFLAEESWSLCANWTYRFISCVLMYIGSCFICHILYIMCKQSGISTEFVPPLKVSVAATMYLFVTAFIWMWFRPCVGLSLITSGFIIMYWSGIFSDRALAAAALEKETAEVADSEHATDAPRPPPAHIRFPRFKRPRVIYHMGRHNRLY